MAMGWKFKFKLNRERSRPHYARVPEQRAERRAPGVTYVYDILMFSFFFFLQEFTFQTLYFLAMCGT